MAGQGGHCCPSASRVEALVSGRRGAGEWSPWQHGHPQGKKMYTAAILIWSRLFAAVLWYWMFYGTIFK